MNSIAVLGASLDKEKFGNKCVRAFLSIGWEVFPINPKYEKIENLKCYPSIKELPKKPDLISIYLPPQITIKLIPDFLAFGVKELILNPGAESEELVNKLKENKIYPLLTCSIRAYKMNPNNF